MKRKVKVPLKVNIFGQEVTIKYHQQPITMDDKPVYGVYHKESHHIDIGPHNTERELIQTIIHELSHALSDRVGIWQTSLSHDVHEAIVETYSKFIFEQFILGDLFEKPRKKSLKPRKK